MNSFSDRFDLTAYDAFMQRHTKDVAFALATLKYRIVDASTTTIAELGAGTGRFSLPLFSHYPLSRLFFLEPDDQCMSQLQKKLPSCPHHHFISSDGRQE